MMCCCSSHMVIWAAFQVCEWKIDRSLALGVTEMIKDYCYHNISIPLNSKYVEMIFVNIQRWYDMACAAYSEYILLLPKFWIKIFNLHAFLFPLKCIRGPFNVKKDRNKQHHCYRTPMVYYVTACFGHSKSWNENKDTYDQNSPRFFYSFQGKKKYYNHAQVDFDFGQVYIVWWLSYSQVGKKISVEPWLFTVTNVLFYFLRAILCPWMHNSAKNK